MKISDINGAEQALRPFVPLVSQLTGKDTTLDRIGPLMKVLGDPQNRLRIVHIAGTSGKTSTSYYIAALLRETGNTVGLTVSPHVDRITERVQIDGNPISDTLFCTDLGIFLDIIADISRKPSYFELLYAFSLWMFDRYKVDYAVVETGMGGLYDATNVAKRQDKVCVITDIGFDHMHILGNTIPEITAQKIGIVHAKNNVCMYRQSDEVMRVVHEWTNGQDASLHTTSEEAERSKMTIELDHLPAYQQRNWLLAHFVYEFICQRDRIQTIDHAALSRTASMQIPGRMDIMYFHDKTIIMDGAHNEQKMSAFLSSFIKQYPDCHPIVLIAMKQGKEFQVVAPQLLTITHRIIVTTFDTTQDLPVKSVDPVELAKAFRRSSKDVSVEVIKNNGQALNRMLDDTEKVCIITGSFYLLSQIRKILINKIDTVSSK
jgi:dihydrofolate synthase/folylpolyglutamate synthase